MNKSAPSAASHQPIVWPRKSPTFFTPHPYPAASIQNTLLPHSHTAHPSIPSQPSQAQRHRFFASFALFVSILETPVSKALPSSSIHHHHRTSHSAVQWRTPLPPPPRFPGFVARLLPDACKTCPFSRTAQSPPFSTPSMSWRRAPRRMRCKPSTPRPSPTWSSTPYRCPRRTPKRSCVA